LYVFGTRREPRIDPVRRGQKIDDEGGLHGFWPLPRVDLPGVDLFRPRRVARQDVDQGCADLHEVAGRTDRRRAAAQQQISAGAKMGRSVTPDDSGEQLGCTQCRKKGDRTQDRGVVERDVVAFGGQLGKKLIDALHIAQPDLQIEHPAGFGVVVRSPG
jgi:hypothetical protein